MQGWPKSTKLHFIGIGGIGMSGIAEVLIDLGYIVSGSDLNSSPVTDRLEKKGATIFIGHQASNIEESNLIIYSSAINPINPEFSHALKLKIPMIRRAEMLAELMRLKFGIAVAGSHGKTTTTSLIATIFFEAGEDATHIIGGIVNNLGGNARKGDGKFLIAEADESDGSFLLLNPTMSVITNIDDDHLDHYGNKENIVEAFIEFVNKLPFYGRIILNSNDWPSLMIKPKIKRPMIWYGIDTDADYVAKNIQMNASGTKFHLSHEGHDLGVFETNLIGIHNVSNALGAISISHQVGINWDHIRQGLLKFHGVGRRLEKVYELKSFVVIDDYGHHPTEIKATISALKMVDKRPLCVVFEPHRFSRTQNFWKEFQNVLDAADEVYVTPIYAASEAPIEGITSTNLVKEMSEKGMKVSYLASLDNMKDLLHQKSQQDIIFLTLGAGAISKKIRQLVSEL